MASTEGKGGSGYEYGKISRARPITRKDDGAKMGMGTSNDGAASSLFLQEHHQSELSNVVNKGQETGKSPTDL